MIRSSIKGVTHETITFAYRNDSVQFK